MKKLISTILAVSMIAASAVIPAYADGAISCITENAGDANRDGKTNAKDVSVILRGQAGWTVEYDADLADVNRDGAPNAKDVALILKYIAEWAGIYLGHSTSATKTVPASCTAEGVITDECTLCKTVFGTRISPMLPHSFTGRKCASCGITADALFAEWIGEGRHFGEDELSKYFTPDEPGEDPDFLREFFADYGIDTSEMTDEEIIALNEAWINDDPLWIDTYLTANGVDISGMTDEERFDLYYSMMFAPECDIMREELEAAGIDTTGMTDEDLEAAYYEYMYSQEIEGMKAELEAAGIDTTGMTDEEIEETYYNYSFGTDDPVIELIIGELEAIGISCEGLTADEIYELYEENYSTLLAMNFICLAEEYGVDFSGLSDEELTDLAVEFDYIRRIADGRKTLREMGVITSDLSDEDIIAIMEGEVTPVLPDDPTESEVSLDYSLTDEKAIISMDESVITGIKVELDRKYLAGESEDSTFTLTVDNNTEGGYIAEDFGDHYIKRTELRPMMDGMIKASEAPAKTVYRFTAEQIDALLTIEELDDEDVLEALAKIGFDSPVYYDKDGNVMEYAGGEILGEDGGESFAVFLVFSLGVTVLSITDDLLHTTGARITMADMGYNAPTISFILD